MRSATSDRHRSACCFEVESKGAIPESEGGNSTHYRVSDCDGSDAAKVRKRDPCPADGSQSSQRPVPSRKSWRQIGPKRPNLRFASLKPAVRATCGRLRSATARPAKGIAAVRAPNQFCATSHRPDSAPIPPQALPVSAEAARCERLPKPGVPVEIAHQAAAPLNDLGAI